MKSVDKDDRAEWAQRHVCRSGTEIIDSQLRTRAHNLLRRSELTSERLAQRARGKQVTSEVEGTLYYTVTHLEANKYYRASEQGVKSKVMWKGLTLQRLKELWSVRAKTETLIYYSGWSVRTWSMHPNTAHACICSGKPNTTIGWKPVRTLYCHISWYCYSYYWYLNKGKQKKVLKENKDNKDI